MDLGNISVRIASASLEAARKKKPTIRKTKEKSKKKTRKVTQEQHLMTPPKGTMLDPLAEYSCQVQMLFDASFSGNVSQQQLMEKLKDELIAAVRTAAIRTAADLQITSEGVHIYPIHLESAIDAQ
jgi:hypothetical protein